MARMTYEGPPPQPVYFVQPVRPVLPPYSGLAIAGFVTSLVWGFGFLSPIGLGLSIAGYRQASRGRRGSGLAVAGIILGALGTVGLIVFIGTGIASWSS